MGFVLSLFGFLFLIAGLATQLVSFLMPNMYENKLITSDKHGIFRRCGVMKTIKDLNPINVVSNLFSGASINKCYWLNVDLFKADASKFCAKLNLVT